MQRLQQLLWLLQDSERRKRPRPRTFGRGYIVVAVVNIFPDDSMEYSKFINEYPSHPLVVDVAQKAGLFDEAAVNYEVPPLAVAIGA